jgi:ribose/xylose/arabinose/galactoside ABC-type transport system permease subunit
MFDSFPYDQWSDTVTDFWTWGGHNSIGTYTLTVLGVALVVCSLIGWVWLEKRKLGRHAAALRATGMFDRAAADSQTMGPGA